MVLDEATTGLDPESASLVMDAIEQLVAGRTTLAVTHDADVALRADRVVWVQDGQVLLDGSPAELLATSQEFRDWVDASNRATMDIRIDGLTMQQSPSLTRVALDTVLDTTRLSAMCGMPVSRQPPAYQTRHLHCHGIGQCGRRHSRRVGASPLAR